MHFSIKIRYFSYKNHSIFNEKSMFSHIPVYRWSWKNAKQSSYFCSKLIFFDSKSSFLSFPVYRWSKKCCKIHQNCSFSSKIHWKIRLLQKRVGRQSFETRCPNRDKSSILASSFSRRLGRQSLQTECPNRDTSSILSLFFSRRLGRQRLPNTMPKARQIVDSYNLLFTTSRSTEGPKHDAQVATTVDTI